MGSNLINGNLKYDYITYTLTSEVNHLFTWSFTKDPKTHVPGGVKCSSLIDIYLVRNP